MSTRPTGVIALLVLWCTIMCAVAQISGCFGHTCDGDAIFYGRETSQGHMVDANTWESTPLDADWVPFTRQRTVYVQMNGLTGRTPSMILPYVSADKNPIRTGSNWVLAPGNLAEQSGAGPGAITLRNNTCADYYLRLVVTAPPIPEPANAVPADGGP